MEEIKKISTSIEIREYLITFEYETKKGYRRTQQRILKTVEDNLGAKRLFKDWTKTIRTMFNAQILSIVELKNKRQVIVL